MTERHAFIKEIGRLNDLVRNLRFELEQSQDETRTEQRRYDRLIQNMKNSKKVPTNVHNHIVLELQPKG